MSQSFLADTARSPKPAHIFRQNIPERPLVSLLHAGISVGYRF
jgi:hypothetical protein